MFRDYHYQTSQSAPDWMTESDHCEKQSHLRQLYSITSNKLNESRSIANKQIRICALMMASEEGF